MPLTPENRLKQLFEHLTRHEWPRRICVVNQPGYTQGAGQVTILPRPRLNLCLGGRATYSVRNGQEMTTLEIVRGEAVYTFAHCALEPCRRTNYLSLGLVFHPDLTRFLIARNNYSNGHSFLLTHHAPRPLDNDGQNLLRALENSCDRPTNDPLPIGISRVLLLKSIETLDSGRNSTPQGKAYMTWQAAQQFIEEHIHRPLDRQEVADFLQVHPNHLSRLFKHFSNRTFNETVRLARLQRARELLRQPELNIAEIALACGFSDPNYFTRCFRQSFGEAPGTVRQHMGLNSPE